MHRRKRAEYRVACSLLTGPESVSEASCGQAETAHSELARLAGRCASCDICADQFRPAGRSSRNHAAGREGYLM
jgi:hypothetical protein